MLTPVRFIDIIDPEAHIPAKTTIWPIATITSARRSSLRNRFEDGFCQGIEKTSGSVLSLVVALSEMQSSMHP